MFTHLREVGSFEGDKAMFYRRVIVVSLEHLHRVGLVYRDLKLKTSSWTTGHVNITDFGFSTLVSPTISAPVGHCVGLLRSSMAMVWTGGPWVSWYMKFLQGCPPYTSHMEAGEARQLEIYEQIVSTKLICPDYFSLELVDLVARLLSSYEKNRLGWRGLSGSTTGSRRLTGAW